MTSETKRSNISTVSPDHAYDIPQILKQKIDIAHPTIRIGLCTDLMNFRITLPSDMVVTGKENI